MTRLLHVFSLANCVRNITAKFTDQLESWGLYVSCFRNGCT